MILSIAQNNPEIAVSLPAWLDLASVAVGGISGALVAKERHLDPIGFIGLSMLCGLGGGLIRDMAMQVGTVYMIDNEYAIPAAIFIGLAVFFFARVFEKVPGLIEWVDIISVGLFALGGTDKAIVYHLLPVSAILMGTLTGVGGGMLRDVFLGDVPRIFKPSNFYAVCAVAGSAVYYALVVWVGLDKYVSAVVLMVVTVGLRRWSLSHGATTPGAHDLTPALKRAISERKKR
ncbi:trimeric intracellular cation channel family protein [Paratractidigestivibacter sp.]|uniref:trimeric intracellular cation channel family protein n=1 Tax=Paratractidigestivibacter sp. TaxID=2847316 RepID=UPI002ABDC4B1|nr:TRIC cation channel family protein [Paratractidigestivibacter sp.]